MESQVKHIAICICTYRRPDLLKNLLEKLVDQDTGGLFDYSIVVCDNDQECSAKTTVGAFAKTSYIPVTYCVEPSQNIARARNRAIANAAADYVAFIDDDEFPIKEWLLTLFNAINHHGSDGVLGPVKPHFDDQTPTWVVKGRFYDRPNYPTGFVIDWPKGRTGNVLLKREILVPAQLFRPEFRAGSDQDFFRRAIEAGYVFVWCAEAVAYEFVPPTRWKRSFMVRRALLRGATASLHPTAVAMGIIKSIIAVPLYAIALPFAQLAGHHRFMVLLVKLCDHLGKLLAFVGLNPVREQYITE
jgi:glycosyltransferase involved in cell wall biosynthesis